ncbi:MAG: DUF4230 domain-containing protein [Chitinophagales bacterium]
MQKNIPIKFVIPLLVLIPLLSVMFFGIGKEMGYKKGHEVGIEEGEANGFTLGYDNAMLDARELIYLAHKGALHLLVDENQQTYLPYQYVVNKLHQKKYKAPVDSLVDTMNRTILKSIVNFESFSKQESDSIVAAYQTIHKELAKKIEKDFTPLTNLLEKNVSTRKLASQFVQSISGYTCDLVALLNPLQKRKLASSLIQAGKIVVRKNEMRLDTDTEITPKLLDDIADDICNIIAKNSFALVAELFDEYATVVDFNESLVVSKHHRELVKKLLTVEDEVTINIKETFKRDVLGFDALAFDANIDFKVNAKVGAGIDLDQYFKASVIQEQEDSVVQNYIVITVAPPKVLTTDIDFNVKSVNEFFSKSLEGDEITALIKEGKKMAVEKAIGEGILKQAETSTQLVFEQLYFPLLMNNDKYKLVVRYKEPKIGEEGNTPEIGK